MTNDRDRNIIEGELLPPQRTGTQLSTRQELPYATPAELLQRMGGVIQRWSLRGRTAAAADIAQQLQQLVSTYVSLHQSLGNLQRARLDHAVAVDDLDNLDVILADRRRQRAAAYKAAAIRDDIALAQLRNQLATIQNAATETQQQKEAETPEVPLSPAERLRQAADLRRELRRAVDRLTDQVRQDAGGKKLSKEARAEIQRIKDDAESLLLHGANER